MPEEIQKVHVPSIVYLGTYQYDLSTEQDELQENATCQQMLNCLSDSSTCDSFDKLQNYTNVINFNDDATVNALNINKPATRADNNFASKPTYYEVENSLEYINSYCESSNNKSTQKDNICKNVKQILQQIYYGENTRSQMQFVAETVSNHVYTSGVQSNLKDYSKSFKQNITDSNKKINTYNTQLINYANQLYKNSKTIGGLQQKIKLAMKVLNGEGNRLQSLTKNLATYRAQNAQHDQDRVPIGLPYLNPFFTMSNRNYVIMMLVFIVLLVIGIFVYAFVGRRSTV